MTIISSDLQTSKLQTFNLISKQKWQVTGATLDTVSSPDSTKSILLVASYDARNTTCRLCIPIPFNGVYLLSNYDCRKKHHALFPIHLQIQTSKLKNTYHRYKDCDIRIFIL